MSNLNQNPDSNVTCDVNEDNHLPPLSALMTLDKEDGIDSDTQLANITYPDFESLKKSGKIHIQSGCLHIHEYNVSIQEENIWTNLLPGQFHVFEQVLLDNGDQRKSHLFLLHETILKDRENGMDKDMTLPLPLASLKWSLAPHTFDVIDFVIKIVDPYHYDQNITNTKLFEQLSDFPSVTIEDSNIIMFSVTDIVFDIRPFIALDENSKIIALKIAHIGSEVNTINRQLVKACKFNEIEKIKYLLHSDELPNHASLDYMNYEPVQWALLYGYHEVVNYLFNEVSKLKTAEKADAHTGLMERMFSNSQIKKYLITYSQRNIEAVCQLIYDLPFNIINKIEKILLSCDEETFSYHQEIKKALKCKRLYQKLDKEIIQDANLHSNQDNEKLIKI
jgi:hypothetical protein